MKNLLSEDLLAAAAQLGGSGIPVRWGDLTWLEARDAAAALNAAIIPVGAIALVGKRTVRHVAVRH